MFDHVTIGASDRDASRRFYAAVLPTLGLEPVEDPAFVEWGDFSIAQAGPDRPVTTRLHIGFSAPGDAAIEAFWRTGADAGYRSDGPPGPRPQYGGDYVGAFLLDPDGNSIEAVRHGTMRPSGIDHLWIRVADRAAVAAFHRTIAPHARFAAVAEEDDLTRFRRAPGEGSFSLVDGEPTTPFHLAFDAPDRVTVDAFHAAAVAAGHPDHGAPGERPEYHPGYYGAFVLDPAGHNVELVHHAR